ncbi:MAG: D-alanyl-D-alanine carboxypeptidase [Rhodocyclaceae bacterium]|nr:D-alanyl-D-alanine carboxypeptidase [Rhodocyclaceae bacterium]
MRLLAFLFAALLALAAQAQLMPTPPTVDARAWLLLDQTSGQTLAALNPDERIEPASLTKLMTAYVVFSAIKQGSLKLDQQVAVSAKAWKAPGSRMFIEPNKPVAVSDLIRGMIVQSGNDACIALAETVAGSEAGFVRMMNHEAARMGLKNTHFVNATGLPDPQHYTTAADLARLAATLIRDFPEFYPIFSMKEFRYDNITQPNRNRLLWLDPTVDGLKTGHTETAGYCLIASARRGSRRLLAVVLGTASDALRAQESQKLLNFGFQAFDGVKLYDKGQAVSQPKVFKGAKNTVKAGFAEDFVLSLPKGMADKIKVELVSVQPLLAPLQQGQRVGTLRISVAVGGETKLWGEYPVVALEDVPVAGIVGRAWDSIRLFFQ